jgi:hypothetical protein
VESNRRGFAEFGFNFSPPCAFQASNFVPTACLCFMDDVLLGRSLGFRRVCEERFGDVG